MKIHTFAILSLLTAVLAAVAVTVLGAQGPMLAPSPPRISEIAIKAATDQAGEFIGFLVKGKVVVVEYLPSGEVNSHEIGSVEFDMRKTNGTIVIDGELYDDREIVDALAAVILREWRKSNPDALPVRRALRGQKKK